MTTNPSMFSSGNPTTSWSQLSDGAYVSCRIHDRPIIEGRLCYREYDGGELCCWYILHHEAHSRGGRPTDGDTYDYRYSWVLAIRRRLPVEEQTFRSVCAREGVTDMRVWLPVCPFRKESNDTKET